MSTVEGSVIVENLYEVKPNEIVIPDVFEGGNNGDRIIDSVGKTVDISSFNNNLKIIDDWYDNYLRLEIRSKSKLINPNIYQSKFGYTIFSFYF